MHTITIRISDQSLSLLQQSAAGHSCSIEEEAAALGESCLETTRGRHDLYLLAKRIAAMTPEGITQTDSVDLLREDRDR